MVQNQVDTRTRRERGEALQEFHWLEEQVCGPVGPRAP
jgi:hypothetical protein